MKRFCLLFTSFIMGIFPIYGQAEWVPISSSYPSQIDISNEVFSDAGLSFNLTIEGFYSSEVNIDNTVFKRIQIPGCNNNELTGHPELPFLSKLIAIPQCSGITITLTPLGSPITLTGYKIYPKPEYIEQQANGFITLTEEFVIDNQIYTINANYPSSQAIIQEIGNLRAQRLARIVIYPIVFNPVSQSITYYENYSVSVIFQNPISERIENVGLFGTVVKNSIMNHDGSDVCNGANNNMSAKPGQINWYVLNSPSDVDQIDADYLIITAGKFFHQNNIQSETYRIAKHRAMFNGFKVAILNVENIVSDAVGFEITNPAFKDEQRIRECIKRIYNNGLAQNTFDGHLGFVLLIGDAKWTIEIGGQLYNDFYNGVPAAKENIWVDPYNPLLGNPMSFPNDYYYSCLTQSTINNEYKYDYLGDVYIGRFPVDNHNQLHNMVEKTIQYETEAHLNELNVSLFTNSNSLSSNPGSTTFQTYFASELGFYKEYLPRLINSPYQSLARDGYRPETNYNSAQVIQDINEGKRLYCYYGHSDMFTYGPGFDTVFFQTNLNNNGEWPFFFANSCHLGYYEDTPWNTDCFAEVIPKFSATNGFVGSFAPVNITQLDHSSQLPIVPISFYEFFVDNLFSQFSSMSGELALLTKIRYHSVLNLPYLDESRNKIFGFNLFCDPALNLFAQGYEINRNMTLSGDIIISNPVYLKSGYTLTISSGTHLYFINNGSLTIEEGATIEIIDGSSDVYFHGTNNDNALIVKGEILNPSNMLFTANEANHWYGLLILNPTMDLTLNSTVSFTNCGLRGIWKSLNANGVSFNKSWLCCIGGHMNVQNSSFIDSYIIADYANKSSELQIKNCNFINNLDIETIRIDDYPIFNIEGNNISFAFSDAISLFNCGSLSVSNHYIINNNINFTGNNNGLSNGIKLYNSLAKILMNTIMNCPIGISVLNLSNAELIGSPNATNSTQTQRIINNTLYQIYLSELSAPPQIYRNAIYRDDITTSPYICYNSGIDDKAISINVNYNYWGGTVHGQFIPSIHLQPYNNFIFDPNLVWNLPYKFTFLENDTCTDPVCLEYMNGIRYIKDSLFNSAILAFKACIEADTGSVYSILSMKQLLALAYFTEVLSLENLQAYYESNPSIQQIPLLKKASAWLSNRCSTFRGNYTESISWLNTVVQSHEIMADSVFAEIELEAINSLLSPELKNTMCLQDIKNVYYTDSTLNANRQQLISLLYTMKNINPKKEPSPTSLNVPFRILGIYPNPVKNFITFDIEFDEPTILDIDLVTLSGEKYRLYQKFRAVKGLNKFSFTLTSKNLSFPAGFYFVKVSTPNYQVYYPIVKL